MPADALNLHLESLAWLRAELARSFDGRTVVCTHHAPCPQSIHVNYSNDPLNPCFISDLSELLDGVDVWVHGHVHNSFDYMHGNTRVLANPRGYALNLRRVESVEEIDWENHAFNPTLVIKL
jgi:Icc-related predicted phosphoesterase